MVAVALETGTARYGSFGHLHLTHEGSNSPDPWDGQFGLQPFAAGIDSATNDFANQVCRPLTSCAWPEWAPGRPPRQCGAASPVVFVRLLLSQTDQPLPIRVKVTRKGLGSLFPTLATYRLLSAAAPQCLAGEVYSSRIQWPECPDQRYSC